MLSKAAIIWARDCTLRRGGRPPTAVTQPIYLRTRKTVSGQLVKLQNLYTRKELKQIQCFFSLQASPEHCFFAIDPCRSEPPRSFSERTSNHDAPLTEHINELWMRSCKKPWVSSRPTVPGRAVEENSLRQVHHALYGTAHSQTAPGDYKYDSDAWDIAWVGSRSLRPTATAASVKNSLV